MNEANDEPAGRLLPIVKLQGTEYLVDVAKRQFKESETQVGGSGSTLHKAGRWLGNALRFNGNRLAWIGSRGG